MTRFTPVFYLLLCVFCGSSWAQKKTLEAKSVTSPITINGKLDEEAWSTAPIATDFTMFEPDNGKPIDPKKKTEVRVLYDSKAIYIAAVMHDDEPSKIAKEITERDNFGTSEHFGVFINGFNDGQQDFRFFVSAAGVQMDCLATEDLEDYSWNAIWESEARITDFGWVVEMRIPYAALRFSQEQVQTWGINFYRELRRDRQKYVWNPIDTKIGAVIAQAGVLQGIHDVTTPTRLFFIPYASYYYDYTDHQADNKVKAGMDIKYGINDSFTVDAILVPDFGQTKFDNVILNLTPFEQQFTENRPFFTEGTDLFNKGNLLYTRRIGGEPTTAPVTRTNEVVEQYPNSVDLLNAIKLSGRTKGGLGVGLLNAVTEKTYAKLRDTITNDIRKVVVEPLVNYNLLVLDQRFNRNSSVSFVNANVTRDGNFRDSNVSALVWDLNTKENTYKLAGDFKYSYINLPTDSDGFKTSLNLIKTYGKSRYDILAKYISGQFDPNDLGIAFINNYYNFYADYSYRIINPTGLFNSFRGDVSSSVEFQNVTGKVQDYHITLSTTYTSKNNDAYQLGLQFNPLISYDFYQPRVAGRYSYNPRGFIGAFTYSSNSNRKFSIDINPSTNINDDKDRYGYGIYINPHYRLSDRILLSVSGDFYRYSNDRGYAGESDTDIVFGERNRKAFTGEMTGRYSLNNKMTLNLTARYYWAYAQYHKLFTLRSDGFLDTYASNSAERAAYDENLNLWNFDLTYSWWFAPASQISILYRNNTSDYRAEVDKSIGRNIDNLFGNTLNSVFSISVRYYIDYNALKRKS